MAQHHPLALSIDQQQRAALLSTWQSTTQRLERREWLEAGSLDELRNQMRAILNTEPAFAEICDAARLSPQVIHLSTDRPALTNLPWRLAVSEVPQLYLVKGEQNATPTPTVPRPLPLKVLVMISAPDNATGEGRLNYETEEDLILRAFEPLFNSGLVEIDFCNDGSLQSLEAKLRQNAYHILHFSGHGTFDAEQGTQLVLEDPVTMEARLTPGNDFIRSLQTVEAHRPNLVLLSSCLTAKGGDKPELQGLALDLLAAGVPAAVAMSLSILDGYATAFAGSFYTALAGRQSLQQAFHGGVNDIRRLEAEAHPGRTPAQWMIPQLYTHPGTEHLVDWAAAGPGNTIEKDNRLLFGDFSIRDEVRAANYRFVGRRADRKRALPVLTGGGSVLLRGQGGVGKTALAEHLVSRLLAARGGNMAVFTFKEDTATLEHLQEGMLAYLEQEARNYSVRFESEEEPDAFKRCRKLLARVLQHQEQVLFVFDNLEDLQTEAGGAFDERHADIARWLQVLEQLRIPMLLTGRYPVPEVASTTEIDLNTVPFNDYLQKCQQLSLKELPQQLRAQRLAITSLEGAHLGYREVVGWLYDTFGGNYRALGFFDQLFSAGGNRLKKALRSLDEFRREYADAKAEVMQRMSKNLLFKKLLDSLPETEGKVLRLLARFRIPVLPLALDMQAERTDYPIVLGELAQLTLLERRPVADQPELVYYYVTPLVRELLAEDETETKIPFDHERAGRYFRYCDREINFRDYNDLAEAWHHFLLAGNFEEVNAAGTTLCRHYYRRSQYRLSFFYGTETEKLCGEEHTSGSIHSNLGLTHQLYGNLDAALHYQQLSLKDNKTRGDKQGEGGTLNNIASIANAKGEYDRALSYLEKSLDIRRQIGDKQGEGVTLNNISQIYDAKGEYGRALSYLEKSLDIQRQIGDKQGEGTTLNNMAGIANAKGEYDRALSFLEKSLDIRRQIGDKQGEGVTLNNMAGIANAKGEYDRALSFLEKSLDIQRQIGDKQGEGVTLNNISQIHQVKGEYDRALSFLEKSLDIRRQIGDKQGEGVTLNNISQIHQVKGEYDRALSFLEKSLDIRRQIGDKQGEGVTLNNMAGIANAKGEYDRALSFLEKSLDIQRQIGDVRYASVTLHNMAAIAREKEDLQQAFDYQLEAWQIACRIKYSEDIFDYGYALAGMLAQAGQREDCLQVLRQSYELCQAANYGRAPELAAIIQQLENQ